MKLRTCVGRDPQEALAQVRKELGPEAVILSTQSRPFRTRGSRLPGYRRVEVTAAVDQGFAGDDFSDFQPWLPDQAGSRQSFNILKEELEEMKALLQQWLAEQGPPPWLVPYQELSLLFQDVRRAGIHDQIVSCWLEKMRTSLGNAKGKPPRNLRERSLRELVQEIKVVDPWKIFPQRPQCWTFLGSTGVGKTTTISKLAIQAAFMKKIRVGLISLDNVRLGGQEPLAAYARISGLPLITAVNRDELAGALKKMADLDLILIDTPGRNPCDPGLPLEMHQLFGDLPGLVHHLVVSATATEGNIADVFQSFSGMPLSSCMVTKVDEVRNIVGVLNQLWKRQVGISFLATGQKVPEDLEPADHRLLAGLLLKFPYDHKAQE